MNIYIHKDISNTVDGHFHLRDSSVICFCLQYVFLKIIVIFPESAQTFTWGGSQSLLFIFRSFPFCMTRRLFPASRGKNLGRQKKMESPTCEKMALIHQMREILTSKPAFIQGVSEKLLKTGNTNCLLSTHLHGI